MAVIRAGLLHVPAVDLATGDAVRRLLHQNVPGLLIVEESYAASQRYWIEETLTRWCDEEELDLVITLGGTLPAPGPSQQQIVPEATLAVAERLLPGLAEAMRAYAQDETPLALLDRSVGGIRGRTLLLNLPAGTGPATVFLAAVVDLIAPVLAHLREEPEAPSLADALAPEAVPGGEPTGDDAPETADDAEEADSATERPGSGLNAADFAAFLRRRAQEKPSNPPSAHEPPPTT